jgi:DNA-binding transcriptional ArsR family regulator
VTPAARCRVFCVDAARVRRGRAALLPAPVVADIAGTFKVLAHATRVRLIQALAAGELCVCELSAVLGLSVSATSHQLATLRALRLVRGRAEGKLVWYSLSDPYVLALLEDCTRHVGGKEAAR